MTHAKVDYRDVEPVGDALHLLREPLGCEQLGFSVLSCPPGWEGREHRHVDTDPDDPLTEDHEEVYFLVEGGVTIQVEDEAVELSPGEALRVSPEATRQVRNGEAESVVVIAGAP